MGGAGHARRHGAVQHGFGDPARVRQQLRRQGTRQRPVAGEAELAAGLPFRAGIDDPAHRPRIGAVALAVEHHLRHRLLASLGLVAGFMGNGGGETGERLLAGFKSRRGGRHRRGGKRGRGQCAEDEQKNGRSQHPLPLAGFHDIFRTQAVSGLERRRRDGMGAPMRTLLTLLILALAACAAAPVSTTPPPATTAYRLGPGDRIRVETFGEAALTGEFTLDGEGRIAFPLIGAVKAADRGADELGLEIQTRLAAQALRDPKVTVQVIGFRPVFVLGEVTRPGEFPFASDLSVFALVAKAGGFTYRADRRRVFIRHAGAPAEVAYKLDAATPVRPGDTVRIGDRIF